jgi:hypothetical protein
MMSALLRSTLFLATFAGCGGESLTTSDAGDASSQNEGGCTKCIDAMPLFDAGEGGGNACPPQAPQSWTGSCLGSPSTCNYAGVTDAGADADIACLCQPHGEDILQYDCATYDECMSASGTVASSVKSCSGDQDCRAVAEQTDCCGSVLWVGVANVSSGLFAACETSWASQYPPCSCAASAKTEDGKATATNGSTASAHCVSTSGGNVCMTTTP